MGALASSIDGLVVAHPDDVLIDVLEAKADPKARVLVTSGERLVGIVSATDVAQA